MDEGDTEIEAAETETSRLCVVTREVKPITDLIRFVLGPDGSVVPDTEARAEGRGVWVSLGHQMVAEAVKRKAFAKSLKAEVTVPEDLVGLTRLRLEQRFLSALGMARKASQFVTGGGKVKGLIESGQLIGLITATDAAEDGRKKMAQSLRGLHFAAVDAGETDFSVPHLELLSSHQLSLALGQENVIHAALMTGAAAQSALEKGLRLARYNA